MATPKQPSDLHKWMSTGSLFLPYGTAEDYAQDDDDLNDQDGTMANADSLDLDTFRLHEGISKYRDTLKVLIPVRPHRKDKLEMPSREVGLCSFLSVTWVTKLMWKAYRQGIHHEDLWQIAPSEAAEVNVKRLERLWKDEQLIQGEKAQFWMAAMKFCRTRAIVAGFLICLGMTFQFIGPTVLIRQILLFLDDRSAGVGRGLLLAASLVAAQILKSGSMSMSWVTGSYTAIRLQGAVQLLLYRKILRAHIDEKMAGQVVNHVTNDLERIFEASMNGMLVLGTPFMFLLTLSYSCYLIGPWALVGNLIILLFYPIMGGIAAIIARLRRRAVKKADERVQLMTEVVSNIRLIKMYAWEEPFSHHIKRIRAEEKSILMKGNFLQSMSVTATPIIMITATVATLVGYTLSGNHSISASEAFALFSAFNGMGFSIGTLPYAIRAITEAKVALQRMQEVLEIGDVQMWCKKTIDNKDKRFAVTISDAAFTWQVVKRSVKSVDIVKERFRGVSRENKSKARASCNDDDSAKALNEETKEEALRDITLHIKKGSLIGVCGSVGSGKSSLLSALCGDMNLLRGEVDVNGSIAIVTQLAWIFNATIRDNILFGLPYLKSRYDMVMDACCLTPDLEQLSSGDLTEIGERGSTISGGQRQRINLARALYSDRDIYLLDDPLSAVDAKVAGQLFQKCIQTAMQGKTVFLVSHSMHFLEKCQQILFMKGGRIIERGTHSALMSFSGEYRKMFHLDTSGKGRANPESGGGGDAGEGAPQSDQDYLNLEKINENESLLGSKLVKDEEKVVGKVSKATYLHYMQAGGGPCVALLLGLAFLAFVCSQMFAYVWLQHWVDQIKTASDLPANGTSYSNSSNVIPGGMTRENHGFYSTIYGMSIPIMFFFGIMKGAVCTLVLLSATTKLHDQMFYGVLRSPVRFFDATPSGRIINRFSKDMDEIDIRVPFFLEMVTQSLLSVLLQLLISVFVYQTFVVVLVVAVALYVLLDHWLNVGVREVKRLDNVARSSVGVHLTTTLQGVSVIRVFECQKWFTNKMYQLVNKHSVAHVVFHLAARWFTLRMELIGICMVTAAAFTVVLARSASTGMAGLMLVTLSSTCSFIPFIMRLKSELMARFTSVERVHEYCKATAEEEAPSLVPRTTAPKGWPKQGDIKFQDVCLTYREGLPRALKGITFHIKGGQKVGIVGRTGAGKSSILASLMRLQELESGHILIDDINIRTLGLYELRSSLAVIPQDPVLFQGTVRYNLDPLHKSTNADLWAVLEKAHLKARIQREENQLECTVERNGENFSVGERQLMCLARALLRHNKILILDEATASVDAGTDQLIQQTIREMFADCTILMIAHRLNAVLNCDMVLVLEAGKVVEMNSPFQLVNDPNSVFSSMLRAVGMTVPAEGAPT